MTQRPDLVKQIARRLESRLPKGCGMKDLERHGRLALDAAVAEYDHTQLRDLETFASNRVRRAMLDAMDAPGRRSMARRLRSLFNLTMVSR